MSQSNESDPLSLRDIYLRALDRKTPESREAFLDGACGDNLSLRNKVEALLRENAEDSFLESPAIAENETIMDSVLESPGTMVGRYKVLQRIGEGGMGAVYMAEQTEPVSRKVALKIIKLGMDTKQVVARFEAERQALAMMDHPNIAKVLDAGATDIGRPFFVMELVRGVPITEYCDKNKLTTKERLELFIPVCQAIQHAHQKGIIHRDVKPSNVMVTLHDGNPVPKVIDFGIAKATNQKLTEKTLFTNYSQMIGTPAYMSPEQAEMSGLDVDTRTDVYSLGVLLYELLTGTTPFPSKELLSMGYGEMQRVISETVPPKPSTRMSTMQHEELTITATRRGIDVSVLQKQFKGDLDWIVMKSLEKDRTHRYETVAELAADVTRHLNNETVNAAAPALSYQIQKLYQRQKKFIRAAGVVFLVLLLGITTTTWQMFRADKERDRANELMQQVRKESIKADEVVGMVDQLVRYLLPELRFHQDYQAATTILDYLDELVTKTLVQNPKAELITRYNLMVGYLSISPKSQKFQKQIQRGLELADQTEAQSDQMVIDKSLFKVWEAAYFGSDIDKGNWKELLDLGYALSESHGPQSAAAITAFGFAGGQFNLWKANETSISLMQKGMERAIRLTIPDRNIDNLIGCYGQLVAILIQRNQFGEAISYAETALALLRKGVQLGLEPYPTSCLGAVYQLSFLYIQQGQFEKALSTWADAADWWTDNQPTHVMNIKQGMAVTEALVGRSSSASKLFFDIANNPDCLPGEWILGTAFHRMVGDTETFKKLWHLRLLRDGDKIGSWLAACFILTASDEILRNLNPMHRDLIWGKVKESAVDIVPLAKARWAWVEKNEAAYEQALDLLQQYEDSPTSNQSWKAFIQFSRARIYKLLNQPENANYWYKQGNQTLSGETLRCEASSAWNHIGGNWILGHIARQEAEEAMGLPISPLKPAFSPTNHSN